MNYITYPFVKTVVNDMGLIQWHGSNPFGSGY